MPLTVPTGVIGMKTIFGVVCLALLTLSAACAPRKAPLPQPVYKVPAGPRLPTAEEIRKAEKERAAKKAAARKAAPRFVAPKVKRMLVIGQKEYVYLDKAGVKLPARIDTGATTSSIHASEIQQYERDGRNWVRFTITDPSTGKDMELERPLVRRVRIKRHGTEGQRRLIVKLWVTLGSIRSRTEFSLTDRSEFKLPVLIGRSFLHGSAVVDVTREYTTSPLNDADE